MDEGNGLLVMTESIKQDSNIGDYSPDCIISNVHGFTDNKMITKNMDIRKKIIALQDVMECMPSTLDKFDVEHNFAPGSYARTMKLPAGNCIIGKIHKHAHLNIISYGRVVVTTEEGEKELVGPLIFTSYAGTKRAVNVLEDTMWTTIHVTKETDLNIIEEEIIAPSYEDLMCGGES